MFALKKKITFLNTTNEVVMDTITGDRKDFYDDESEMTKIIARGTRKLPTLKISIIAMLM